MKPRFTILLVLLFCFARVFAQADSLQREINQQVWHPFIKAFQELDTRGFMQVHSPEMTRVIQDGKLIYGYDRYEREMEQGNESARKGQSKRTIELRFLQRVAADGRAFEVGYYKFTAIRPDGNMRHGYGKFHVLLRKENGTWKILMDADASEKTNESIFMSASPMQ